jgi:hypothetical protein
VTFETFGRRALVTDAQLRALLAVDLTTVDRTIVSDAAHGTGESIERRQMSRGTSSSASRS